MQKLQIFIWKFGETLLFSFLHTFPDSQGGNSSYLVVYKGESGQRVFTNEEKKSEQIFESPTK